MSKVININPIEQLKKDLIKSLTERLSAMDVKELQGLLIAFQYGDNYETSIIGMDFGLLGFIKSHIDGLGQQLLEDSDGESYDD